MKKIYVALFLFGISVGMNAQLTLTKAANEPVIGDSYTVKEYDSTTVIPKTIGSGQAWNFTALSPQNFTETTTYTTAAAVPAGSLFPSANLSANRGTTDTEFYNTSGANWEWLGRAKITGPVDLVTTTNSAVMASWPISFASTNNDLFVGAQTIGTVVSAWNGSISYSGSGSGTVILPGGATFTNCLQVIKTISLSIVNGTNVSVYQEKTYSYYTSGKKFPIIEVLYRTVPNGTIIVNEYNIFADLSLVPVGIDEGNLASSLLSIYPNPANEMVYINTEEKIDLIEIINLNGSVVREAKLTNSINVSGLIPSVYTIRIKNSNTVFNKRLVIAE